MSRKGGRVDPIFVLRIDLDLGHGRECARVEGRQRRFRNAERREMGLGRGEAPVIGKGRPVASGGAIGLLGGIDRGTSIAFGPRNGGAVDPGGMARRRIRSRRASAQAR